MDKEEMGKILQDIGKIRREIREKKCEVESAEAYLIKSLVKSGDYHLLMPRYGRIGMELARL